MRLRLLPARVSSLRGWSCIPVSLAGIRHTDNWNYLCAKNRRQNQQLQLARAQVVDFTGACGNCDKWSGAEKRAARHGRRRPDAGLQAALGVDEFIDVVAQLSVIDGQLNDTNGDFSVVGDSG